MLEDATTPESLRGENSKMITAFLGDMQMVLQTLEKTISRRLEHGAPLVT